MSTPGITPVTMPKFGLSMTEGKIAAWTIAEGSHVTAGEPLADIETTKITSAYESPASGVLRRRIAPENEDLPVGALIGIIAAEHVSDAEIDAFIDQFRAEPQDSPAAAAQAAPEPRLISVGGRTLRYQQAGPASGAAVVFVHGFGGDLNNWLFNQPALAEAYMTYALDLPGHGGSDKHPGGDLADLSLAVAQFLEALSVPQAHFVAHSLGGAVALRLATRDPSRVLSLSLIAPAGLGADINTAFIDGFIKAERRKQLQTVLAQLFFDPKLVSREMIEGVQRFKRLDGATQALAAIAAANFANGRQSFSFRKELEALEIPVQLIWGEGDRIIPSGHADGLPPRIERHVLPRTGHMPHMERAADVNRLLTDQLAR